MTDKPLGGVRAIISKGWSSRMAKVSEPEPELPPECFALPSVPHESVFRYFIESQDVKLSMLQLVVPTN